MAKSRSMAKREQRVRFWLVPVGEREDGSMDRVDAWFEVPLGGTWQTAPWRAAYRVRPWGDRVVVVEVRVFPHLGSPGAAGGEWNVETGVVPEGGMSARLIRDHLVLGTHVHELLPAFLNRTRKSFPAATFSDWLDRLGYPAKVRKGPGARAGEESKGRTDRELAELAAVYVSKRGERAPVEATAEEVGLPATVVRDALHKAREKGVLTRTQQGRAGGELTPWAMALLEQASREIKPKKKGGRGKQ